MAQTTLKDFFPSKKKTEENSKEVSRKRLLGSYTVPRAKKRKVATILTVQKDKPNASSTSSTKAKNTKLQSNSTTTPIVGPSTSKMASKATESVIIETTTTCATPRRELRNSKTSQSPSPLTRGAACLKLALDKGKTSSSPLISQSKIQVKSFKEARRKLFIEPSEDSTSSAITVKEEKDKELSHHPVQTRHVPSPMKKQQQGTPDCKSSPKLNHFKALQYDSPTKKSK